MGEIRLYSKNNYGDIGVAEVVIKAIGEEMELYLRFKLFRKMVGGAPLTPMGLRLVEISRSHQIETNNQRMARERTQSNQPQEYYPISRDGQGYCAASARSSRQFAAISDRWKLKKVGIQIYMLAVSIAGNTGNESAWARTLRQTEAEIWQLRRERDSSSIPVGEWIGDVSRVLRLQFSPPFETYELLSTTSRELVGVRNRELRCGK